MIQRMPIFPTALEAEVNRYVVTHDEGPLADRFVNGLKAAGLHLDRMPLEVVKQLLVSAARASREQRV